MKKNNIVIALIVINAFVACTKKDNPNPSTVNNSSNNVQVSTLAGSGSKGFVNETGSSAIFNYPTDVVGDGFGNVYVADQGNHVIRKISPAGVVTTFAGSGNIGSVNGTGINASFNSPQGIAIDASGNILVGDTGNHLIRKISPIGVVTTIAGSGNEGLANGTGALAEFSFPGGIAVDAAGNIYVADAGNHLIRKITSAGVTTTLAGSGKSGSLNGTGILASFDTPEDITVDASGYFYVADTGNNLIRKISPNGIVTTFAGNGNLGSANGIGVNASFNIPNGIAVDKSGNILVGDTGNNLIRTITSSGIVSTLAGSGMPGSSNGSLSSASFFHPVGIAVEGTSIYISDYGNHLIRKIK